MATSVLCSFLFLLSSFVYVQSKTQQNLIVRIYPNVAEIVQPIDKLPIEFSEQDWAAIRSESINLIGKNVNVTSQRITRQKKSLNGAQVFVRLPVSFDKSTDTVVKGTIVDEQRYLVKLQDDSIINGKPMYFTVNPNDIFYLEEPSTDYKYHVDFTYTAQDENTYVSYLQTNLQWRTQYQLCFYNNEVELIAKANIINNANSSVSIKKAELISYDVNLQNYYQQYSPYYVYDESRRVIISTSEMDQAFSGTPIFSIDTPFIIDGQTNYLLPMPRPQVNVERYHAVIKAFSQNMYNGKAERFYRLQSNRNLSRGNCTIRENNQIVGEILLPNLPANYNYEFSIGQDSEVSISENVTVLLSNQSETWDSSYHYRRSSINNTYNIQVKVTNVKDRSIVFEYKQGFGPSKLQLDKSTNNICICEDVFVKCKATIKAYDEFIYFYEVQYYQLF